MQMNDDPVMCLSIWGSMLLAHYNESLVHARKIQLGPQARTVQQNRKLDLRTDF